MLPLLPFVAGVAAGATASELLRRGSVRRGLNTAGKKLRTAASSGMETVRQTSAHLRESVSDTIQKAWPGREDATHTARRQAGCGPSRQAAKAARARARASARASSQVSARKRHGPRATTAPATAPAKRSRTRKAAA
ncbi:MAG: hypothetical protein Q4A16_08335 [Lautropia sp.]|nr:hypothetical protein [Lautropia sp.]